MNTLLHGFTPVEEASLSQVIRPVWLIADKSVNEVLYPTCTKVILLYLLNGKMTFKLTPAMIFKMCLYKTQSFRRKYLSHF